MMIDSHHHLWRPAWGDYDWLTPDLVSLYRDFDPEHLTPLMEAAGVYGGVVVQAAATEAETLRLLEIADRTPTILGVVGWTDFAAPNASEAIARLARHGALRGFRPMLQDLEDDDFILRPPADAALRALSERNLVFDALVRPRHLSRLWEVRRRHPDLTIVVDHGGKPDIASRAWEPWASDLRRLAADGRTFCKLSGLVTEAGAGWSIDHLRPYAELILEAFGPDRVLWGSDWPVLNLAADYETWVATALTLVDHLPPAARGAVMGGTARGVYGLGRAGSGRTSLWED